MTGTEDSGAQGDANFFPAPPARSLGVATIAALLAITSFLPGVPAAQAQTAGSTRLELVRTDFASHVITHKWSDNNGASWSDWTSLGAPPGLALTEIPAVISDGYEHLYVIAASYNPLNDPQSTLNGGIWYNTPYNHGSAWNGWAMVPGQDPVSKNICTASYGCTWVPQYSPAVSSWGAGRVDLFVVADSGGSRALLHTWADNDYWSGTWEVVNTCDCTANPPGVVSWALGRIDVFWESNAAAIAGIPASLKHMWFDNGQWHPALGGTPEDLGGPPDTDPTFALFPLSSPPVAASPKPYLLTVFTRGRDGHLYGKQVNSNVWSDWLDVGCCLATDVFFDSNGELQGDVLNSVAATSLANNTLDAFVIGTDHALYRKTNTSAGWLAWQLVDNTLAFNNIAVVGWVPIAPPPPAPPPPPPPPPPPTHQCGRAGQPPCVIDP